MFTDNDLKRMIVPLFFEQLLVLLVGIIDTFVVSFVGEAAVSGVSLVNMFNTIFIFVFTALAAGGAVIISQYIGNKDSKNANKSASQLLLFSIVFSLLSAILVVLFNEALINLLFPQIESAVMESCITYLRISAYSYPALAIYNAGSSLFRSMGKTSTTMYVSLISNIINVIGNLIGVFTLNAGVAGIAYASLIARGVAAIILTYLCFNSQQTVFYSKKWLLKFDWNLLKKILKIALPNGIENGLFQLTKVILGSVVALFGTYQIAANGIAQSIWQIAAIMSMTMGSVYITVIGQCMGANDLEQADFYFKKLMKLNLKLSIPWNLLIIALTPLLLIFFNLSNQTKELIFILVVIHNIFNTVALPFAMPLSNGLRAAGDVKFTMYVIMGTTLLVRLVFSLLFAIIFNWGVIGIALAMVLDWIVRAIIFIWRYQSKKWQNFQLI
ncbi:MAG: MATE family efflux transporter [Erysipelotrichaceae bacterium]